MPSFAKPTVYVVDDDADVLGSLRFLLEADGFAIRTFRNGPALLTAVQNALQSTSLGTSVVLVTNSPTEGYYCINSSNALQYVGDVSSKPADCTAAGMLALQPGEYHSLCGRSGRFQPYISTTDPSTCGRILIGRGR